MSSIPYNYGSYIDAKVSMTDTGHVSAGKQIQSPASAGSRGLAKTTQFTNDRTQMQMGNSPIAESMIEIRNILNRIDGVNVPVKEGHYPHIKSFDKLYGINDKQQYKAMADDAQSMDMGEFMDTYSSVIDMAGDFWEDHQKTSESMEGTVNEDPNTLAKELASEIMRWVRRGFDHIPADALKPKAREYLRSVKKPAVNELADDDKIEFTKVMLDISQIKDRVEALSVDEEAKKSAIQSLTNAEEALVALDETAVKEDAGEDEKVVDMLRKIKQHLDNHPNMNEHPSLVALDQLADDLESGDKPADYESAVQEDLDYRSDDILNKAGFDPMKVKEYMAVFNDHGDTSDIEQMNMDKVGLADAMSMVLASHDIENESYEPFPEEDEFNIEEDEDFEEVLGPLGFPEDETELFDAEYQGRKVPLNKPMRGDVKKFKVYVKDPKTGNVKKVNFGHGGSSARKAGQKTMKIRKSNPKARKSFRARHNCANPGPKTKARYWSCRKW